MLLIEFMIVIFINFPTNNQILADRGVNIGTVLFAPSDANKDCWSADNLALLTARMVMEGILPEKNSLSVNDERIINDVIEYFRMILEVVRKNTSGKVKHLMLMALTDTLGGYMKHYFLPLAKYAYYAGNVKYHSVIKVHQLYDELKNYLRTNGQGWSKPPSDIGRDVVAQPIQIHENRDVDPCKGLVYTQKDLLQRAVNGKRAPTQKFIQIAMPYFDSKNRPSAIAIPFKSYALRNIESKNAAYIVVKFYIASTKCLSSKDVAPSSIQEYNTNLFAFIMNKVVPHFCDERFYAAFGGVLRILETMKASGYVQNSKVIGSFNIMPETEDRDNMRGDPGIEDEDALDKSAKYTGKSSQDAKLKKSKSNLIMLAALTTIIIWFFLGACFVCCRIRSARMKKGEQMKLLEGAEIQSSSSSRSSKTRCLSTASSHTKCSTMSGKTPTCNRETCANFSSSSNQSNQNADTGSSSSKTTEGASGSATGSPKSVASSSASVSRETSASNSPKEDGEDRSVPITVATAQYYPATFACHSSMSGKYKPGSSSEDFSSKSTIKKPFVFGYDFQTTSEESSPREMISDGETEMGNISK